MGSDAEMPVPQNIVSLPVDRALEENRQRNRRATAPLPKSSDPDLQQLLAECRQTRRSTVKLLGESTLDFLEPEQQAKRQQAASVSSSVTTVLMEGQEGGDRSEHNSKQEAAASFIADVMKKAVNKYNDEESNGRLPTTIAQRQSVMSQRQSIDVCMDYDFS